MQKRTGNICWLASGSRRDSASQGFGRPTDCAQHGRGRTWPYGVGRRFGWAGWVVLALLSCHSATTTTQGVVGGETNWLVACDEDRQCGEQASCLCGVCTSSCEGDGECGGMSHARCAVSGSAARDRVCAGSTFQRSLGLCLPDCVDDSDCHGRDACVEGLCTKPPADLAQDVQGARQGESQDAQNPEPTEVPDSSEPAAGSGAGGDGSETSGGGAGIGEGGAPLAGACTTGADCASGICEGQGCGDRSGVCADAVRACTQDFVEYCGCDGQTFGGSGSCPGDRYQHVGPCEGEDGSQAGGTDGPGSEVDGGETDPGDRAPASSACTTGADCASGICEGQGCGDGNGVCADALRACTQDFVEYCGCDGQTFGGSGSCPGKRYQHMGPCESEDGSQTSDLAMDGSACTDDDDCASGICGALAVLTTTALARRRPVRARATCDNTAAVTASSSAPPAAVLERATKRTLAHAKGSPVPARTAPAQDPRALVAPTTPIARTASVKERAVVTTMACAWTRCACVPRTSPSIAVATV